MGEPQFPDEVPGKHLEPSIRPTERSGLFGSSVEEPPRRGGMVGIAAAIAVLVIVAAAVFVGRSRTPAIPQNTVLAADPYARNLVFTQLAMSESTSLSGGKSTFLDGHVKNGGPATLTGITMQVLFRNDVGLSPQVETLPLTLIRTHEPYVDTEPVSAAPLKPGDEAEFRLIVETVTSGWNQQMPELVVVHVAKR